MVYHSDEVPLDIGFSLTGLHKLVLLNRFMPKCYAFYYCFIIVFHGRIACGVSQKLNPRENFRIYSMHITT